MEILQTAEILDNLGKILYASGIIFTLISIIALVESQIHTYIKIILLFLCIVATIIGYALPSKEAYVSSKVLEMRTTNIEAYNNLPQVLKDIETEYYSTLSEK